MREQTHARCESHRSLHSWKALGYCDAENSGRIEVGHNYLCYIKLFSFCFPTRFIAAKTRRDEVSWKVRGSQNKVKKSTNTKFFMFIFTLFQNFCIPLAFYENFWLLL